MSPNSRYFGRQQLTIASDPKQNSNVGRLPTGGFVNLPNDSGVSDLQ